jgi:hypothetical protein
MILGFGIGCGGLLLLCFVAVSMFVEMGRTAIKNPRSIKFIDSALTIMENERYLDVTRTQIMEALPEMTWARASDSTHLSEVYIGKANNGGVCELMSPVENLVSASYFGPIRSADSQIHASTDDAIKFINAIDPSARGWMVVTFENAFQRDTVFEPQRLAGPRSARSSIAPLEHDSYVIRESKIFGRRYYVIRTTRSGSTYRAEISVSSSWLHRLYTP